MKTWDQAREESGLAAHLAKGHGLDSPWITHWHVFKADGTVEPFATRDAAFEHARWPGGTVKPHKVKNPEYLAWEAKTNELTTATGAIWHAALREDHSDLPEKIFDLCYDMAYERGHSAGYDEVAGYMVDIVEFAVKIMQETKK